MKAILLTITVQLLTLFTFLYYPHTLNLGPTMVVIPQWGISIATILGNVVWIWGLLMMLMAVIFTVTTLMNDGEAVINMAHQVADKTPTWPMKWISVPLLYTSYAVYAIGLGSGFWFTGFMGLAALVSMIKYRREYWKRIDSNRVNIFDRVDKFDQFGGSTKFDYNIKEVKPLQDDNNDDGTIN